MPKRCVMNLNFEPISLAEQKRYLALLGQSHQVASDYSFLNLWAWAEEYGLHWAWEDNLVWIKQTRPEPCLWAPIGAWDSIDWRNRFAAQTDSPITIIRVPEKLVEYWRAALGERVGIAEAREHWDYLYSAQDLIELKGNRFHKKKNLLNQFLKSYEFSYMPFGPELIEQAMSMQQDWCTWRDCEGSDTLVAENKAIAKVLNNWQQLSGVTGGGLRVDNTLAAYTVAEIMPDNSLVIHFEKACPDFKGSYQAINQMFLENDPSPCTIVNREQDLGDEGLRKAKLSYNPVDFVRKYRVTLWG